MFGIFKKKPPRVMTREEEEEEIMLRLTFPEVFARKDDYKSVHGIDIEEEIRAVMRAELDARRKEQEAEEIIRRLKGQFPPNVMEDLEYFLSDRFRLKKYLQMTDEEIDNYDRRRRSGRDNP
jgi:hypothetical protein